MSVAYDTETMIKTLRYLMAPEGTVYDFAMPSLLKNVPSITSSDSAKPRGDTYNAKLGSSPQRDI